MDTEHLVRRAAEGDLPAFVELTRRFQHFAFASALTLVGDFHHAEDVVQEALVAAWSSLPRLTEPKAFPGWLRSIVRHHAFRAMRRTHLEPRQPHVTPRAYRPNHFPKNPRQVSFQTGRRVII
jgi:DNA-directed RNA polymerase specialized sigma24 family protein